MTAAATRNGSPLALVAGLVLAVAAGYVGASTVGAGTALAPRATDAAWVSEESGTLTADAGTVAVPVTTCTGQNGAPNLLDLTPAAEGLEVTAYRITLEADGGAPQGWNSGTTAEGYPLLPVETPAIVPASTSTVAWGITGGWNTTFTGTATVEALGPGGWISQPAVHEWSIGFDFLGVGYGSCT